MIISWQDLAVAVEEADVVKFTDVVKEFDSFTRLVSLWFFFLSIKKYFKFYFVFLGYENFVDFWNCIPN